MVAIKSLTAVILGAYLSVSKAQGWWDGDDEEPPVDVPRSQYRKEVRELTDKEWDAYTKAVIELKNNGSWDRLADFHSNLFRSGIHNGPQFLPWHRMFLEEVDSLLHEVSPGTMVPYWDWTIDAEDVTGSVVLSGDYFGNVPFFSSAGCVKNGAFGGFFSSPFEPCIERNRQYAHTGWDIVDVQNVIESGDGDINYDRFRNRLEGLHNMVHVGIGGNMNSGRSPYDPIFYSHHAMIDKIWFEWQQRPGNEFAYDRNALGDTLVGYDNVTVGEMIRTLRFKSPTADSIQQRAAHPKDVQDLRYSLNNIPVDKLKEIPRTCSAPQKPENLTNSMFWSPATDLAVEFAQQRVDVSLKGEDSTCINMGAARMALGIQGSIDTDIVDNDTDNTLLFVGVGAGTTAVLFVAALVAYKKKSAHHPGAQATDIVTTNPAYNL